MHVEALQYPARLPLRPLHLRWFPSAHRGRTPRFSAGKSEPSKASTTGFQYFRFLDRFVPADKLLVAHFDDKEPWWHPEMVIGFTIGCLLVTWLVVGLTAAKLGRIAIGRD